MFLIFRRKHAPITTYENFKIWLLLNYVFLQKIYIFHCKTLSVSERCEKKANMNVNEIKRLILLSFSLFIKINVEKLNKILF